MASSHPVIEDQIDTATRKARRARIEWAAHEAAGVSRQADLVRPALRGGDRAMRIPDLVEVRW
jgi:hypothetical protein